MKKSFICLMLALFCISMGFSVNKNEQSDKSTKVVLTGYIQSKGSMPFTQAAIKTEDGQEYLIFCNDKTTRKLLNAQGYKVKLTGYIETDTGLFILKKWKKVK